MLSEGVNVNDYSWLMLSPCLIDKNAKFEIVVNLMFVVLGFFEKLLCNQPAIYYLAGREE